MCWISGTGSIWPNKGWGWQQVDGHGRTAVRPAAFSGGCRPQGPVRSSSDTFGFIDFAAPPVTGNFTSIKPGRLKLPELGAAKSAKPPIVRRGTDEPMGTNEAVRSSRPSRVPPVPCLSACPGAVEQSSRPRPVCPPVRGLWGGRPSRVPSAPLSVCRSWRVGVVGLICPGVRRGSGRRGPGRGCLRASGRRRCGRSFRGRSRWTVWNVPPRRC